MIGSKTIAVVIPAYNEEKLLPTVLANIPAYVDEVVVIDDGSTDNTKKVAKNFGVTVLSHKENKGLASALKTGWKYCLGREYDIIVEIAGDAQHDPKEIKKVISPILVGEADYTKGTRFVEGNPIKKGMPRYRYLMIKIISYFTSLITGYQITDASCGFTCMRKEVLKKLDLDKIVKGYGFNTDLLFQARIYDVRVKEVPIETIYNIGETSGINPRTYFFTVFNVFLKGLSTFFSRKYFYSKKVALFIGVALLIYFLSTLNLSLVGESIKFLPQIFLLGLVVRLAYNCIKVGKWKILCHSSNIDLSWKELAFSHFASTWLAVVTPAKIGELLKADVMKEAYGTKRRHTVPLIITERLLDLISWATVLIFVLIVSLTFSELKSLAVMAVLLTLGIIGSILYVLRREKIVNIFLKFLTKKQDLSIYGDLNKGLRNSLASKTVVPLATLAITNICVSTFLVWYALKVVGDYIPFLDVLGVVAFLVLAITLVAIPGGIGVTEISFSSLLLFIGATSLGAIIGIIALRIGTLIDFILSYFMYSYFIINRPKYVKR
jgi:uncharacterized protein (TIRG00374 family)